MHVDLVGPLPPSGGRSYILTCVDRFTRWPEAIPLHNCSSETVAHAFFERWVAQFGCPSIVTTDRGSHFDGAFGKLLATLGCQHHRTTAYHPAANGMVERLHRQLKAALMAHGGTDWTEVLPIVLLGLRSTFKTPLQATVAELTFGRTLVLPGEYVAPARQSPFAYGDYVARLRHYMGRLTPPPPRLQAKPSHVPTALAHCPYVFLRSDGVRQPLTPPYAGPYKVVRRTSKTVVINRDGREDTVTIDRVKPAVLDDIRDTVISQAAPPAQPLPVPSSPTPLVPSTSHAGVEPTASMARRRTTRQPVRFADYVVDA